MSFRFIYLNIFFVISSAAFSQSATVQTIARAGGASADQVPNGWYNIVAAQSDGWSFTVSGFIITILLTPATIAGIAFIKTLDGYDTVEPGT